MLKERTESHTLGLPSPSMEALCPPTNETVCLLLQLCNATQNNTPHYCWQEKTDGTDRFQPGVSLVSVSVQMSSGLKTD